MHNRSHRAVRSIRQGVCGGGNQSGLSCACWRCPARRADRRRKPRATPSATKAALPAGMVGPIFRLRKFGEAGFDFLTGEGGAHPQGRCAHLQSGEGGNQELSFEKMGEASAHDTLLLWRRVQRGWWGSGFRADPYPDAPVSQSRRARIYVSSSMHGSVARSYLAVAS